MTAPMTFKVHVVRGGPGRLAQLREGTAPLKPTPTAQPARVARLVAVAHHVEDLVRSGTVRDYAQVARLVGITRSRASQIVGLLLLAPDIQEHLLFMERRTGPGREPLTERDLRPIALITDWTKQRAEFGKLMAASKSI